MADARDGPAEMVVRLREAQAVQDRDRAGAHRDDVAQDAADARRRTLEGLDRRGVVVRLDLEGDGFPLAEVDDARILTGALQNAFPLGGKPLEQEGRVLVATVLRPEQGEDGQLEVVRVAAEQLPDSVDFLVGQAQYAVERLFRRDLRQGPECSGEARWVPSTFPLL